VPVTQFLHNDHLLQHTNELSGQLLGRNQKTALAELRKKQPELQSYFLDCIEHNDSPEALKVAGSLSEYWWMTGQQKVGLHMFETVMPFVEHGDVPDQAKVRTGMGGIQYALGNFGQASECYYAAAHLLKNTGCQPHLLAYILDRAGMAARQQMKLDDAARLHHEALGLLRNFEETKPGSVTSEKALCFNNLGVVEMFRGHLKQSLHFHEQASEGRESAGDVRGQASSLNNIAQCYRFEGDLAKTLPPMLQALKLRESLDDTWGVAGSHANLTAVYAGLGDYAKARMSLYQAVSGFRAVQDTKLGFCECLESGAELAQAEGRLDEAVTLFASATKRRKACQSDRSPVLEGLVQTHLRHLKEQVGESRFNVALSKADEGDVALQRWEQNTFELD